MPEAVLRDRIAIVTGGESGIGAACSTALASAGADIAILYHNDTNEAEAVARLVEATGRRAVIIRTDVGVEADVEGAFDHAKEVLGVPDILINSAGLNMSGIEVADMSLEQWNQLIRVDLTGSFLTSRRFVRELRAAKRGGAIINITSIHSSVMRAGGAV